MNLFNDIKTELNEDIDYEKEDLNKNMREPKIENKYNLTVKDIQHLSVNRDKLCEPLFWRNNVVNAWCITEDSANNRDDYTFGTYDTYWLGIYDEDAKVYAGKVKLEFTSYGGMCWYKFNKFYQTKDIQCLKDLEIQEKCLAKINYLIDNGILILK